MTLECIKSDNFKKFEIKVKCKSEYDALIDTGANCSFLSKKTYEKEGLKLLRIPITIKQAVDSFKTTSFTNWCVNNKAHNGNIKFNVVENLDRDIIFGCDSIRILKIDIKSHLYALRNVDINDLESENKLELDIGDDNLKYNRDAFQDVCENFKELFSRDAKVDKLEFEHTIELMDRHKNFSCPKYRRSLQDEIIIEGDVREFLEKDMICESQSRYVSPVDLVKQKNDIIRFCIDYRFLNKITIKKEYPIPLIEYSINELQNSSVYSTLDLKSGYHQLKIKHEDRHKTAFLTKRVYMNGKECLSVL
ncbi:Transposon Ty3-I Gag-Pol polyprotein [Dictyocoela muelleri]|nr:Transposon Ty3-I Gag-Pol polyprotein [Dictyocoela muelleri]